MKDLKEFLSYDPESGEIRWKKRSSNRIKVGEIAGCLNEHGYLVISFKRKQFKAHRIAWYLHFGSFPKFQIDHINFDKSDNRIRNLRDVPDFINQSNKPVHLKALWGTSYHKKSNSYLSRFTYKGKCYCSGYSKTMTEAHERSVKKFQEVHFGNKICG